MRGVYVPTSNSVDDYYDSISKIPEVDSPEVFGLPANIDRSVQRAQSTIVLEKLGMMASAAAGIGGFDREEWKKSLGPLLSLWSKLIESNEGILDEAGARRSTPVKKRGAREEEGKAESRGDHRGDKTPIDLFVERELEFAVDLVALVNNALVTLKRILYGSGLLTPESLKIGGELLRGCVPASWEKIYEGDPKPTSYVSSIVNKTVALKRWKKTTRSGALLNGCLDLSEVRPCWKPMSLNGDLASGDLATGYLTTVH